MSERLCEVCGAKTDDGVVLVSIDEWVPLCSPLCRIAFAEDAATYLGAALLQVSAELAGIAPTEAWTVQ